MASLWSAVQGVATVVVAASVLVVVGTGLASRLNKGIAAIVVDNFVGWFVARATREKRREEEFAIRARERRERIMQATGDLSRGLMARAAFGSAGYSPDVELHALAAVNTLKFELPNCQPALQQILGLFDADRQVTAYEASQSYMEPILDAARQALTAPSEAEGKSESL
jgi:hypothetical protein